MAVVGYKCGHLVWRLWGITVWTLSVAVVAYNSADTECGGCGV